MRYVSTEKDSRTFWLILIKSHQHSIIIYLFILGLLMAVAGCSPADEPGENRVIAEVGINQLTLDYALSRIPEHVLLQDSATAVNRYRQQWIRNRVLADEAVRMGIRETDEFKNRLDQISDELAIQLLLQHIKSEIVPDPVSIEDAADFYMLNRDSFILSERQVRFHHLTTNNINDANRARNELLRGEPWEEIVERYSSNKAYALRNSNIFHPISGALEEYPAMAQFIRVIGVTEVSQIRQIGTSFHFVQLIEERSAGEVPDSEWAFTRIQDLLTLEQKRKHLNAFEQNLIRRAEANREIKIID